jgi:MFS family permease
VTQAPGEAAEGDTAAAGKQAPAWRAWLADTTPLRENPDYRRWWFGYSVSFTGTQLTQFAIPVQVYFLTHSSLAVGLVGLVVVGPLILMGLIGGSIADAVDRRLLTLVTSSGMIACSALLTAQAALHLDQLWLLYVIAVVQAMLGATDSSARGAILPRLVRRELIPSANALGQLGFNTGLSAGPLVGGVLIGTLGFAWAYALDAASFLAVLYAVWRLPPMPPEEGASRPGFASVLEGLRFLGPRKNLLMTFLVDINAMVFGMPRALFPAIGLEWFHGGAGTVGLLAAAPSVGALLGAATSGWARRIHRQGLAVLVSVCVWGGSIAAFGFTRLLHIPLGLALVLLAVAGAADMVSAIFRNTILQVATPDALRGRLQGVFIVVVTGGPRVGDFEAGAVANAFGLATSVVSGGLACIAGVALLTARYPSFAGYDARDPVP